MEKNIDLRVSPKTASDTALLKKEACRNLGINPTRVKHVKITRRSIDARQRRVMVNISLKIYIDEEPTDKIPSPAIEYRPLPDGCPCALVVGAGPAGLFASLRLIELGIKPILLERGKDVDSRRKDLASISRTNCVDSDSNYCFGEGGAGAYSDGKLYTRSKKRGSVDKVLTILHQFGASQDILIDAHPHIGTDKLPDIIRRIREQITKSGGEVHFSTRVTNLIVNNNSVIGVETSNGRTFNGPVILATGHSARDVYQMLHSKGIDIEPKGLAIGVRLEHPQKLIDCIQYHSPEGRGKYLPAAEYSMLTRIDGRAVYSFCMCPGGFIIPASSGPEQLVVNGMSPSSRGTKWANSGMVVEILPEDVTKYDSAGPLKMMEYQKAIERKFYEDAKETQNAPAQRMTDFTEGRDSTSLPATSYAPGIHPSRIDKLLPPEIADRLRKGFIEFGKKAKGFLTDEAALIGCETRTSSPIRICRDAETLEHVKMHGLFPCGEGAGYAGGIVSAAIDGERCADATANYIEACLKSVAESDI
ncbi:MAG: FAD-binding protein [Muribaculum sp.]|nr:FAD-binding protein [Muribaculum sp.]